MLKCLLKWRIRFHIEGERWRSLGHIYTRWMHNYTLLLGFSEQWLQIHILDPGQILVAFLSGLNIDFWWVFPRTFLSTRAKCACAVLSHSVSENSNSIDQPQRLEWVMSHFRELRSLLENLVNTSVVTKGAIQEASVCLGISDIFVTFVKYPSTVYSIRRPLICRQSQLS